MQHLSRRFGGTSYLTYRLIQSYTYPVWWEGDSQIQTCGLVVGTLNLKRFSSWCTGGATGSCESCYISSLRSTAQAPFMGTSWFKSRGRNEVFKSRRGRRHPGRSVDLEEFGERLQGDLSSRWSIDHSSVWQFTYEKEDWKKHRKYWCVSYRTILEKWNESIVPDSA